MEEKKTGLDEIIESVAPDPMKEIMDWFKWAEKSIKRMAKILYANELISIGALAELLDVSVEEATQIAKEMEGKDRLVD